MPAQPLARFAELVDPSADEGWRAEIRSTVESLRGRVVWHVSSTARGGGVAEMMGPLVGYARDAGVDARWMVIAGPPEFFALTKRLHNRLHADGGDGGPLGAAEHRLYEGVLRENAEELAAVVRRGDDVVLHDPQTAGLVPSLSARGAIVVWRCHIGHEDLRHPLVAEGWEFLRPSLERAAATVFSREAYVPAFCRGGRVAIVRPAIDPTDLDELAAALGRLLGDEDEAGRLGAAARERVRAESLGIRLLADYARLIGDLVA